MSPNTATTTSSRTKPPGFVARFTIGLCAVKGAFKRVFGMVKQPCVLDTTTTTAQASVSQTFTAPSSTVAQAPASSLINLSTNGQSAVQLALASTPETRKRSTSAPVRVTTPSHTLRRSQSDGKLVLRMLCPARVAAQAALTDTSFASKTAGCPENVYTSHIDGTALDTQASDRVLFAVRACRSLEAPSLPDTSVPMSASAPALSPSAGNIPVIDPTDVDNQQKMTDIPGLAADSALSVRMRESHGDLLKVMHIGARSPTSLRARESAADLERMAEMQTLRARDGIRSDSNAYQPLPRRNPDRLKRAVRNAFAKKRQVEPAIFDRGIFELAYIWPQEEEMGLLADGPSQSTFDLYFSW
ncbi:hypothetical protein RI367_008418 [Sorochytrium milnesiophthora]